MIIYSIGPNDFVESIGFDDTIEDIGWYNKLDTSNLLWMIIWYFEEHFEGYGELAAMSADGKLRCYNISHCHGMSPVMSWANEAVVLTVDEFVSGGARVSGIDKASLPLREAVRLMVAGQAPSVQPQEFVEI